MDREADVTVSESDRLHSQLSRFEGMFPGYRMEIVEFAIEVVSPSSVHNDYEVKDRAYARRGIPNHLVFDPYQAHCVTLWNPGPDGYRGRDTIPYGGKVVVGTGLGKLTVDTSTLPVDPCAVSR
ncbi:Uma2 family endonuclease [Streptomyces nojiriensis]